MNYFFQIGDFGAYSCLNNNACNKCNGNTYVLMVEPSPQKNPNCVWQSLIILYAEGRSSSIIADIRQLATVR